MRLRHINKSRRKQLAEHECSVLTHLESHDLQLADRDPNGDAIQRLNFRLFNETEPAGIPDSPPLERESWLPQGVQIFRPVRMADTVHPDDYQFFDHVI